MRSTVNGLVIRCTLGFGKDDVPLALEKSHNIYNGLNNNQPWFSGCPVPLPTLLAAITAVETAQENVSGLKAKGLAQLRATKVATLWTLLTQVNTFVQVLCDESPEMALAYIAAAGLQVMQDPSHAKEGPLVIRQSVPGAAVQFEVNVKLLKQGRAKSKSSFFSIRASNDGGKTFPIQFNSPTSKVNAPNVNLNIPAIPPGVWEFEVALSDADGITAWSQAVTFTVR